jgi:hypothetical protein
MRLARHLVPVAACACVAVGLTAFGCSLGLDPSLIGQDAAVASDAEGQDGSALSDGGDAKAPPGDAGKPDSPISVDAGACNTNADCQAAASAGGSCVTAATCDTTSHTCSLVVCGNSANCQAEVCQPSQTCTLPATYGFAPASFQVTTGGIGGFGVQYSIAAAWPFVFVVTNNGLTAYNVVDPTNNTPPVVPLQGVPFIPVATLAVGRRVYFITGTQGSGPTSYRQAIAWVDVPQNPLLTSLQATSAFVSTPDSPLVNVFSNGSNGLFFLYGGAMLEPAAIVAPPLDSTTTLAPFANTGLPNGAGIVASTGGRLLSYRYDATNPNLPFPHFAFINKPGTSSATTTPEVSLNQFGGLDNQWAFATGSDGSVLWATGVLDELDSGGSDGVLKARLSWLVDSASAANFDTTSYVDLATYSPPVGGQLVGQPAWINAGTALGFASLSSIQTNTTLVQVVYKTPASIDPVRNTQLGVPPGAIGVATSNGFGYALLQNDPFNRSCTVQILAPSCGGADQ